ncbi:sugar-binding domain-containing protein, partial [Chitinophaga sancti]|uniref:sugar-binding domain-containing protein n=1 Tax=Chitinophaga sancti TaxID=1004 RepID=UPI003F7A5C49
MKKFTLSLLMLGSMSYAVHAQQNSWHLIRDRIVTPWSEKVDPNAPLPEYPRPQLVRENSWKNLNGLWSYAITAVSQDKPAKYEGSILVPFAVESALSGVGRTVGKDSLLWYNTNISIPATMKGKEILLHFGAVDWQTEVFVNGKSAGKHEGGFDPFSFNITSLLRSGAKQDITIRV